MEMGVSKHIENYAGLMRGRVVLTCLVFCVFSAAYAEETQAPIEAEEGSVVVSFERATDEQIGGMLQRWPQLDAPQRRDLLAEVRKRMRSASQIQDGQAAAASHNRAPSLTLRIKRAQTQHSFGRTAPRGDVGSDSGQTAEVRSDRQNAQRPRELVIRATVTQILPDGRKVTRQKTLVPSSLRAKLEKNGPTENSNAGLNADSPALAELRRSSAGKMTVRRTTVRFGTGFHQRHQVAGPSASIQPDVRRISSPEGVVSPGDVRLSVPVTADSKKTN